MTGRLRSSLRMLMAFAGIGVMIYGVSLLGLFLRYPMDLTRFLGSLGSMAVVSLGMGMAMPFLLEGEE